MQNMLTADIGAAAFMRDIAGTVAALLSIVDACILPTSPDHSSSREAAKTSWSEKTDGRCSRTLESATFRTTLGSPW
jgi:hypothetical protein